MEIIFICIKKNKLLLNLENGGHINIYSFIFMYQSE